MKNYIRVFSILALTAVFSVASAASWVKLGTRTVSDRAEYDTIVVGADEGKFSKLRFGVKGTRVELKRMTVHFRDGSQQRFERNASIKAGERSDVYDLEGKQRVISKVVFYYETRSPGQKRAQLTLYGRR